MLTSATKRVILPFSSQTNRGPLGFDTEEAAVFVVAESERGKGGGLFARQPEERLVFLSKVGYPLWLVPKNDLAFIFDALNDSAYSVSYSEVPSAKAFLDRLEANSRPRESYEKFLTEHSNYFQQPPKEKAFALNGLVANLDFKDEFNIYRKEARDAVGQVSLPGLLPILEENTVSSMLSGLDGLQSALREDAQRLPECIRLVNKTTSQYLTELDYAASAVRDEAEAKIRAQQEVVNPKVAKLNTEYRRKIKDLTDSFDQEIENLQKLQAKTEKYIENGEGNIKQYEREARAHAQKNHKIYEKRWKEKIKHTEKELNGLRKELKNIEGNLKKLEKQKAQEISSLTFEWNSEVKLARQPLLELEANRDERLRLFRKESERLFLMEKPVIEGLNRNIRLREANNEKFEALGIKDPQLKTPALFYVPFYVCCYEAGLARRYLVLPPSTVSQVDFSAKLKGAFGMSKIKDLFVPRFRAIATLIEKVEVYTRQNSVFESQLWSLGERNNLLKNASFIETAHKGLVYLKHAGWLSDKEQQLFSSRLTA